MSAAALLLVVVRADDALCRRYKIRRVIGCGVISAELLQVIPSAADDVVQPKSDANMLLREPARSDEDDEHPRAVRDLARFVDAVDPSPVETLDIPFYLQSSAPRVRLPSRD